MFSSVYTNHSKHLTIWHLVELSKPVKILFINCSIILYRVRFWIRLLLIFEICWNIFLFVSYMNSVLVGPTVIYNIESPKSFLLWYFPRIFWIKSLSFGFCRTEATTGSCLGPKSTPLELKPESPCNVNSTHLSIWVCSTSINTSMSRDMSHILLRI